MESLRSILLLSQFYCSAFAAVTIIPAIFYLPGKYSGQTEPVGSDHELLVQSYPKLFYKQPNLYYQRFMSDLMNKSLGIHPSPDSFVRGIIDAWAQNQHFVIRPADVWFTILTQMNFYLSNHQDIKEVHNNIEFTRSIEFTTSGFLSVWNPVHMVQRETRAQVKTNTIYNWIQPNFEETSPVSQTEDAMTANLLVIGFINSSSSESSSSPNSSHPTARGHSSTPCGMPSITLLGTQKDWQQLLLKLDRMPDFGSQPADYGSQLRPILSRFVRSFEEPNNADIRRSGTRLSPMACKEVDVWIILIL
jgi:hypothetical protein